MRKHNYRVSLKEFLKLLKSLASSGIHMIFGWLDLLFNALYQERKRKKGENFHKTFMGTLSCCHSPFIYTNFLYKFFIKSLIIMSISTNIQRPYVCDPLGLYISIVNNSIGPITPY